MPMNLSVRKKRSLLETVFRTRRDNMRRLIEAYRTQAEVAAVMGWNPSLVTHIAGENATRSIGEKLARDIEAKFGLKTGWLDVAR